MRLHGASAGLLAVLLLWAAIACGGDSASLVQYDPRTDLLRVQARDASLREVFGIVMLQSGVEIVLAPGVERRVSLTIPPTPLPEALQRIAKTLGLNHALIFAEAAEGGEHGPLLVRMRILPQGARDGKDCTAVVTAEQEVVAKSRGEAAAQPAADVTKTRWQNRLGELPAAQRQHLEELALHLQQRQEERIAQKNTREAEAEARRAEQEKRRSAREEQLRAAHPQDYPRRLEQREANRHRYLEAVEESPSRR